MPSLLIPGLSLHLLKRQLKGSTHYLHLYPEGTTQGVVLTCQVSLLNIQSPLLNLSIRRGSQWLEFFPVSFMNLSISPWITGVAKGLKRPSSPILLLKQVSYNMHRQASRWVWTISFGWRLDHIDFIVDNCEVHKK